jgi:hypothetical protein
MESAVRTFLQGFRERGIGESRLRRGGRFEKRSQPQAFAELGLDARE